MKTIEQLIEEVHTLIPDLHMITNFDDAFKAIEPLNLIIQEKGPGFFISKTGAPVTAGNIRSRITKRENLTGKEVPAS